LIADTVLPMPMGGMKMKAANMPEALRLVETGQAKGKIVTEDF